MNNVSHVLQSCKETGIKKLDETTERLDVQSSTKKRDISTYITVPLVKV